MIKSNFINDYAFDFNAEKIVKKICKTISKLEAIKDKHILSIIMIDDEKIHEINNKYRNIDRSTDVISFALGDGESELPEELGDIFISYDHVLAQANQYGHSIMREFSFLVTHGVLHLLGYDHMTKEDEEVMFKKQDQVLEILKIGR